MKTAPLAELPGQPDPPDHSIVPLRHAALLARLLAESMIMDVQKTTALNRSAADALMAQARITIPLRFAQIDEAWSSSWRSFERYAHTADTMIGLAREHFERNTRGTAQMTERLLTELAKIESSQTESLRAAFADLVTTQKAYLKATKDANQLVVELALSAVRPKPGVKSIE